MENTHITQSKQRLKSHEKDEIRIVKVAAFCFALVSWLATGQGLYEYVFRDRYVQAILISFGIQAILFVLNLRLPAYFKKIGERTPADQREHRIYHFGAKKGQPKTTFKWNFWQRLIAFFYVIVLLSSSFFSFVYITNFVYADTKYIDANVALNRRYRTYLDDVDKYINELTKSTLIVIGERASELQKMIPDDSTNGSFQSENDLRAKVKDAERDYKDKDAAVTIAQKKYDFEKDKYEKPMSEWWRNSEVHEKEYDDYLAAADELERAMKEKNDAETTLENAQQALENYEPPANTTIHDLLVEVLKPTPNLVVLNSLVSKINDKIVQSDEGGIKDFATVVTKTQELTIAINNYSLLREIQSAEGSNSVEKLKDSLLNENIVVPVPTSTNFESQRYIWESGWKERFSALELIVNSVPDYLQSSVSGIDGIDKIINIQQLSKFDALKISRKIDKIVRSNLADINALERACGLLISGFPFLAWFSLLFALFLDTASLLAGLFVYLVTDSKKEHLKT